MFPAATLVLCIWFAVFAPGCVPHSSESAGGGEGHRATLANNATPRSVGTGDRTVSSMGLEVRVSEKPLAVYAAVGSREIRGRIQSGEPFAIHRRIFEPGCGGDGWASVRGDGVVCLGQSTQHSLVDPVLLPRLVSFIHPGPLDWERYSTEGVYDQDPPDRPSALVPYIYAKVWRKWRGKTYSSAEAYESGASPISQMSSARKLHFVSAIETARGTVLARANGTVVPRDQIFLYPITDFHGRKLGEDPVQTGRLAAWVFGYAGASVRSRPSSSAPVVAQLPYHQAVEVFNEPVDATGHWWAIPDAVAPGIAGYVHDQRDIRHWVPSPRPPTVGASQVWIDIDLGQQVLALRRGDDELFVTMISSGDVGWATPLGVFEITDKATDWDMASKPDAEDPYYVEKVPWTMHFKPRYAIHGVFWHWGFGHVASHGCVNLSVRDARYIFDRVLPTMPAGWNLVYADWDHPGTPVRIRRGTTPVRDRRSPQR